MIAHVLLNYKNELRKRDKCEACILSPFCNESNKFNTGARMLDYLII